MPAAEAEPQAADAQVVAEVKGEAAGEVGLGGFRTWRLARAGAILPPIVARSRRRYEQNICWLPGQSRKVLLT